MDKEVSSGLAPSWGRVRCSWYFTNVRLKRRGMKGRRMGARAVFSILPAERGY